MFLIDSVDEKHVFASAGNLATPELKYLVTNRRVITALLEITNFTFFPLLLSYAGIKFCVLMDKEPSVQFPASRRNSWLHHG